MNAIIPIPKMPITVRVATLDDLPFIDKLQKIHSKMVGWMPGKQLEGKIEAGEVLIADVGCASAHHEEGRCAEAHPTSVGYVISRDQYFKHDDVGIIYQLNVAPTKQRGLIGATLIKSVFERAAYGCKLFCCWCAQDIEANYFWESLGFIPLAFRAGSRDKGRVHIFWQRRIREGDVTTPYWFPSQTTGGAIREDRLVFPIPPGTHWSDAKPIILPGQRHEGTKALRHEGKKANPKPSTLNPLSSTLTPSRKLKLSRSMLWFPQPKKTEEKATEKTKRAPRQKVKNDPRLIAAARELRDRWLEHVNSDADALLSQGKYAVGRQILIETRAVPMLLLPAA
jgi:hypothetical protein